MPAFGFKARFAAPIREGLKTHTIRGRYPAGFRLGHWCPLYTGMRTRSCTLIASGLMNRAYGVRLDLDLGAVETETGEGFYGAPRLDVFAVSDGFGDWADLKAFWEENHKGIIRFSGVLMGWGEYTFDHRLGAP
jgi:hypothetical protein